MLKASWEDWIESVKHQVPLLAKGWGYDELADLYSFKTAYQYNMKPDEALIDCIEWLESD